MEKSQYKTEMRAKRHNRLRHSINGTAARPRLAVYRSNKFVYAQLIDDEAGKTLAAVDSRSEKKGTGVEKAKAVGTEIAKKAGAAKITVAEVEEMVPLGTLDPNQIHVPGTFVKRIFQGETYEKRIEQRTVRQRN